MAQNRNIVQVVDEAYKKVPELAIQAEEPVEVGIRKLAPRVREAKEEIAKVQLELNLQITEL